MSDMEEVLLEVINSMEGEGVDFKEDVGLLELVLESRPDLLVTVEIVDRASEEAWRETDNLMGRLH